MPNVRPLLVASLVAIAAFAPAQLVLADDSDEPGYSPPTYSHRNQLGLHAQVGTGYRVLFPYNKEYCGQTSDSGGPKSVCTGRSPAFLDVGLSFGLTEAVELLAEVRLGLETDFDDLSGLEEGPRPFSIAAGARLFVDAEGKFKFFSSIEGVVETTDYSGTTLGEDAVALEDKADFGLRNVNGIQFDFHRTFGLYVHFGETVTFANWLRFELHGGLGVQARFPLIVSAPPEN